MARKSAWSFKTSAGISGGRSIGGGLSVGVESQSFTLVDPRKVEFVFTYQAVNVSFGVGSQNSPKIGVGGSTEEMGSTGGVWMTDSFSGAELSPSDFEGLCMFGEGTVAVGASGSAAMMWLGCPKSKIVTELADSPVGFGISGLLFPFLGPWGQLVDHQVQKLNILPSSVFEQGSKAFMIFGGQGATNAQITASLGGGYGIVELASKGPEPKSPPPRRFQEIDNPKVIIPLPTDFLFDFDHSDLRTGVTSFRTMKVLVSVASRIQAKFSPVHVEVRGYTDSIGAFGYNLALSKARAETVRRLLIRVGLAQAGQISIKGFGSMNPVASNATEEGRARNRRVEIAVY